MTTRVPTTATIVLVVLIVAGTTGCSTTRETHAPSMPSRVAATEAEGVFVRHLRLRVKPSDIEAFEDLVQQCVAAAAATRSREDWLCYFEPPCRYWFVFFSDTLDGFTTPTTFGGFVRHVSRAAGNAVRDDINVQLASIDFNTEWEITCRQYAAWSSVEEMSTATHPKARMIEYTIQSGSADAFARALAARTAFLQQQGYPLPIEGFVQFSGEPGGALQVVFPASWMKFHESESIEAFAGSLIPPEAEAFRSLDRALRQTVSRIDYYDGDFVAELSYSPP